MFYELDEDERAAISALQVSAAHPTHRRSSMDTKYANRIRAHLRRSRQDEKAFTATCLLLAVDQGPDVHRDLHGTLLLLTAGRRLHGLGTAGLFHIHILSQLCHACVMASYLVEAGTRKWVLTFRRSRQLPLRVGLYAHHSQRCEGNLRTKLEAF